MTSGFAAAGLDLRGHPLGWYPVVFEQPPQPPAGSPTQLRAARKTDGPGMWQLASRTGLDLNSPYAYAIWGLHHHRSTLVAEQDDEVVGFTLGYLIPGRTRTLFIWQIAVDPAHRSGGLASRMLDTLCGTVRPAALEATVTTSNRSSDALFRSFARRHGAPVEVSPCFSAEHFPGDHEAEHLYQIDLRAAGTELDRATTRGESFLGTV